MKKRLIALLFSGALVIAGCKTTAPTPPLAPGYANPADQSMGEILAGAHAFYLSIQQQSAAGTMTLSAQEKTSINAFGVSLNAADAIYLAYHSGQATQAAAQASVNLVQQQQAALPLPGAK